MSGNRRLLLGLIALIPLLMLPAVQSPPTLADGPGSLIWENRESTGIPSRGYGVGVQGNIVVAGGEICDGPSALDCDWFVQAHDKRTGETLWTDRFDGAAAWDRTQWLAVDAGHVYLSGWTLDLSGGGNYDFLIRAHRLTDGVLLWEQRIDRDAPFEFAEIIGAHGGRVFAGGRVGGDPASGDFGDFAVFALDARTGEILWESVTDPSESSALDIVFSLSTHGDKVFVSGGVAGLTNVLVQAHDAKTGQILWQQEVPTGYNLLYLQSLEAAQGLVFATGLIQPTPGDFDAFVHAYDQNTGNLIWSDQVGDPATLTSAQVVTAAGGHLFSGIRECELPFVESVSPCSWVIRSYEPQTGFLQWETRLTIDSTAGSILTIAQHADKLVLGGFSFDAASRSLWSLAVLNGQTGELLWDDAADPGAVLAIDVQGGRLYAAGTLNRSDPADTSDFTVRAYALN